MRRFIWETVEKCEDVLAAVIFYGYFIVFLFIAGARSLMETALKCYLLIPVIIYFVIKLLLRRK